VKVAIDARKTRIEVIPLIDVIFLLLVFFIYAMLSMSVHHGLPVDLPASDKAPLERGKLPSITVEKDGNLFLEGEQVPLQDLGRLISIRLLEEPEKGVMLFADRDVPYHVIFDVMEEITLSGIRNISLQARPEGLR
jgi:biopolymer transport protein ExbD